MTRSKRPLLILAIWIRFFGIPYMDVHFSLPIRQLTGMGHRHAWPFILNRLSYCSLRCIFFMLTHVSCSYSRHWHWFREHCPSFCSHANTCPSGPCFPYAWQLRISFLLHCSV